MKKNPLLYFSPAIVWVIISSVLFTIPGSSLPKENWLSLIWADKWVHVILFFLMVFLFCWGAVMNKNISASLFLYFTIAAILYGIGIEFVQKFWVINRSFDLKDIIADTIGSALGFLFSSYRYIKK